MSKLQRILICAHIGLYIL